MHFTTSTTYTLRLWCLLPADYTWRVYRSSCRCSSVLPYLLLLPLSRDDVDIVRPLDPHRLSQGGPEYPRSTAGVGDGEGGEVLREDNGGTGERGERGAQEERELKAARRREPHVPAAPASCQLRGREGDERAREAGEQARVPAWTVSLGLQRLGEVGTHLSSMVCVLVTTSPYNSASPKPHPSSV